MELKPCPFCGREAEVETHFSCVFERIYGEVRCGSCKITIRGKKTFDTYDAAYEGYDTPEWVRHAHEEAKQSAIDRWNTRVGDELAERMIDDGK